MSKYRVQGERETGVESQLPFEDERVEVREAVRIDPSMRAGGPLEALEIGDDDLLEVELENGLVLWTTIDRLQRDTERAGTRDGGQADLLPLSYPSQRSGAQRGGVGTAIKAVKVLGLDLPKGAALAAANKIEGKLEGDGKFFRLSAQGDLFPIGGIPDSKEPSLVLVHGTFSSTASAFSGFFKDNSATWSEILDRYEGRVYGFDHKTMTKSPLENALEFLEGVPGEAPLHLVTHSRGGLVGDLIAHGGVSGSVFAKDDVERELQQAFKKSKNKAAVIDSQRTLYDAFNRSIVEKAPRVDRYVRVACPAAGTTVLSGRLDVYLSVLIHLLRHVPAAGILLGALGEFVAAVAKERTKPDVWPGLEAQIPKSAFVRLLNSSAHTLDSDLTVLAGDSDGFLKNLANLFYWRANDLIVDTRSMYGGAARARRLWHLEENRDVTHVNYFSRFDTAQKVQRGLFRADNEITGFQARVPKGAARGHVDVGEPGDNVKLPGVVLLPGIMGSHLSVVEGENRERIWLDKSDLMKGKGEQLKWGVKKVEADAVLKSPYDDFRDYLARQGLHVMPMPYDWRASLEIAAARLNDLVQERLAASTEPVHLIGHSMGGLVASLFMARFPDTWKELRKGGGRLVQAGTPNLGSYVIPRILQGTEKMIRILAWIDLASGKNSWAGWAAGFQGVLELAPNFDDQDFARQETWKNLSVIKAPLVRDLKAASLVAGVLKEQAAKLKDEGVVYVAGGPTETPVYDPQSGEIRFTMQGDGRATWDSGVPSGIAPWYIPVKHGSLLDSRAAFPGLRELLLTGTTSQLTKQQPAASTSLRRGEAAESPLLGEEEQIEFVPSLEDLEEAVLGMDEPYAPREKLGQLVQPCEVSVVHGNLRFVENPVIVGHYKGDAIVHAEAALDWCLDGALRSRHQLDLYPGEAGTAEAVLKQPSKVGREHRGPQGAIVVGLGHVGELTSGGLTRSLEKGLLRYAQTCRDRGMDTSSLKVSALLVGSGEAGVSIAQLTEAFLAGVENANQALERLRTGDGGKPAASAQPLAHISHLEFIELYQDIALEALHALRSLPAPGNVKIAGKLLSKDGGRYRARVFDAPGWWTRLSILTKREKHSEECEESYRTLSFTAFGERARVATTEVHLQRSLVDRLLAETIQGGDRGDKLPQALFELLVPPALKGVAADRSNLQLVLDPGSAEFPWELVADRMATSEEQVGVGAGLLRQLRVADPRVVSHPEENVILVVGDPPSGWPALPAARTEAEKVADLFEPRDWQVVRQIRAASGPPGIDVSSIMQTLLTTDARILHLAGHGTYDAECPSRSGMVLGGGSAEDDPLVLLTPSEVRQMRLQPELVFINCCHLGKIEDVGDKPFHRLAANLAAEFIQAGVKAVVAAGWPVGDSAAETFADTLYTALLGGEDFGMAVRRARIRTRELYPDDNTWGAYQCYGDPGFRLLMDLGVRAKATGRYYRAGDFLDVSELRVELLNLVSRAKIDKAKWQRDGLFARSAELEKMAERKTWLEESGVLAGFGRVYGQLRDFKRAIDCLERASRLEDGGVTLRDLEQLANYRVRLGKEKGDARAVRKGLGDLRRLIDVHGPTLERHSLLGASYKRQAQLYSDPAVGNDETDKASKRRTAEKKGKSKKSAQARKAERARKAKRAGENKAAMRRAVHDMTLEYERAADLQKKGWYYPATNALLGVLLLGGPWARPPRDVADLTWADKATFEERLVRVEALLLEQEFNKFWDAVALPDLEVVNALSKKELDQRVNEIASQYRQTIELYGSTRQVDSVIEHLSFAATAAKTFGQHKRAKALGRLKEALVT